MATNRNPELEGQKEKEAKREKPLIVLSRYLEQDGHIRRETDPHDRRKTLVCITPEGEAARLAGEQAINAYVARILDRISPDDLARMLAMKDVFLAAIEAENEALEQNLKTGGTPYDTDL